MIPQQRKNLQNASLSLLPISNLAAASATALNIVLLLHRLLSDAIDFIVIANRLDIKAIW